MIISRTPFRISFVGGGSDLKNFYSSQPGRVLSTTINKYMYIYSHRFFDEQRLRVKYSKTETVASADYLKHPILREVLRKFGMKKGLEISSNADIPAGTGLGSSSSFTVGLLRKRPGANAFDQMITIGRAKNNDLVVEGQGISKFHGYVMMADSQASLTDAGSKNGTTVGGKRLEPRVKVDLAAGDRITLGSIKAVFFTPEMFYDYLREVIADPSRAQL